MMTARAMACACVFSVSVGAVNPTESVGAEEAGVPTKEGHLKRDVYQGLFQHLIAKECKVLLCLLSINGVGIDDELYQLLKRRGVEPARPDDFVFENGAYHGLSKRNGKILDAALQSVSDSEALLDLNVLTGAMNSRACRYHLRKQDGRWMVDEKETRCTIS
jgi:hypothetical protein